MSTKQERMSNVIVRLVGERDRAQATVARVQGLCDVVARVQPADPDTGERQVSWLALVEALHPDFEDG